MRKIGTLSSETRRFYEELGEKYKEAHEVYDTPKGQIRYAFIRALLLSAEKPILDVGCGECAYRYDVGVDIARSVLLRLHKRGSKHSFILAHASYLPFQDNTFKTILMSEILEHIADCPQKALEEAYRVSSSRIIITTPSYDKVRPQYIWMETLNKYGIDKRLYYHTGYKPEELKALCEEVGFRTMHHGLIQVKYPPSNTFYIGSKT